MIQSSIHCTHTLLSGVELFGSETDEATRRKHYTTLNDLHKRTWTPTSTERVGLSQLVSQLLHLLLKIFSDKCGLSPPTTSYMSLQQFCRERFDRNTPLEGEGGGEEEGRDYLKLAHPQLQALSLVYADTELLSKLLKLLNVFAARTDSHGEQATSTTTTTTASSPSSLPGLASLYEEFVLFLYDNCQDHSCFFQPIQHVLDTSSSPSSLPATGLGHAHHLSKLFISLLTRAPTRAFRGRAKPHKTAEFIRRGGGLVVLRSLVNASRQQGGRGSGGVVGGGGGGFSVHTIQKLGQRDTPHKTISDSSVLVDYFPHCSAYLCSSKGTNKLSHASPTSSSSASAAQTLSLFQHTYAHGERWVELHVMSPHPVLLHNFICCLIPVDTSPASHAPPSKMAVECSLHGGQHSLVPVTPVFPTHALKMVNIAFHRPVLTQHMVVRLYRPLLSATVVVSKVEMLATSFSTHAAQCISPRCPTSLLPATPTWQDQEHQG